MNALKPLIRECRIFYYRWARHDLRLKPSDPGVSEVIIRLNDLMSERPRPALKNRCASGLGLCNHDAACADYSCEGHPWQRLQTRDGGHQVCGEFSVRMHVALRPAHYLVDHRVLLGICGAAWIVLLAWALHVAGIPVVDLF